MFLTLTFLTLIFLPFDIHAGNLAGVYGRGRNSWIYHWHNWTQYFELQFNFIIL